MRTLFTFSGEDSNPTDEQIAARHEKWLEVQDPDGADHALLLNTFHYHPLTAASSA